MTGRSDETQRRCVLFESRPATTTSDKPRTQSPPRHYDSPGHPTAVPVTSEGDVPNVIRQQSSQHQTFGAVQHVQPAGYKDDARTPSGMFGGRRVATSPRSVDSGTPCQQPQPITSVHFDSGEIETTPPGVGADDDEVTWGLNADRCVFETTFPAYDRRGATSARVCALPSNSDHIDDEEETDFSWREHVDEQRPRQTLRRWRTLEDIHGSMDSVAVVDDDGSGDTEDRWISPTRSRRRAPPPPRQSGRATTERRSVSMLNQSTVGFYVDSGWDSTDETSQDEAVGEYRRRRRRDDGAGDRWSGAELLELEPESEDWLDVLREVYGSRDRAERMSDPPSPRRRSVQPQPVICTLPSRTNKQPLRTLTTTVAATPTAAIVQQSQRSAVPTRNSASETRPSVGETRSHQVTNGWRGVVHIRIQTLLLALFIIVLLAGFVYKHPWPPTPPKHEPDPPESSWWNIFGFVTAYATEAFD